MARHGYAGPASSDPKIEMSRPLLPEGIATITAMADAMWTAGEIPNSIFCSPYQRTIDTAIIYGKKFGVNVAALGDLAPIRPLTPGLVDLVGSKGREKLKRVMLVCHVDNTTPTMRDLDDGDWAKLVMGEVRRVSMSRKDLSWKLKWGLKPSDIGLRDRAT
jgi:phosphohistidine phosphatase SixA